MSNVRLSKARCAAIGNVLSETDSHPRLNALFQSAGAPGDPPDLAHHSKWKEWLFRAGQDPNVDSLSVLGNVLEEFMDLPPDETEESSENWRVQRRKIEALLEQNGFRYFRFGRVLPQGQTPSPPGVGSRPESPRAGDPGKPTDIDGVIQVLVSGLRRAMHPLTHRRRNVQVLSFSNEYDVQDLLHALLRPWVAKAIVDESKTQHPENTQGVYNAVNLNKRGITLDLSTDEGKDIFWRMLPEFDVVCENFRPGVLEGWGITLDTLAAKRPDVILAGISGYGVTGPYAAYPANGATTEPMSGLASIHGYEGDPGMNTGGLFPDPISGYAFASAIIAALARRDRVNAPQRIDVAMLEAMGVVVGDAIAEYDATGQMPVPIGNRDRQRAPHNIYPCAGDDEWVAISISSDSEWQALCQEMAAPNLPENAQFADAASRKANESHLDEIVAAWTSPQDASEVERRLQSIGIDAARVAKPYAQFSEPDPTYLETGFVQSVDHPEVGRSWLPGAPWRFSGPEDHQLRPSPCVGQHSFEVFAQELGMSESDYRALVERRISGTMDDV